MPWVKLLAPLFTLLCALSSIGLQSKWRDKRTKWHRWVVWLLVIFTIGSALVTEYIVFDEHRSKEEMATALSQIQRKEDSLLLESVRQSQQLAHLTQGQADLQQQLEPFKRIARGQHPTASTDEALRLLASELDARFSSLKRATFEAATLDVFRPLTAALRDSIIHSFTNLRDASLSGLLTVGLVCEEGNRDRELVADELLNVLRAAGFRVDGIRHVAILGRGDASPRDLRCHPDNEGIARMLTSALDPLVTAEAWAIPDSGLAQSF